MFCYHWSVPVLHKRKFLDVNGDGVFSGVWGWSEDVVRRAPRPQLAAAPHPEAQEWIRYWNLCGIQSEGTWLIVVVTHNCTSRSTLLRQWCVGQDVLPSPRCAGWPLLMHARELVVCCVKLCVLCWGWRGRQKWGYVYWAVILYLESVCAVEGIVHL